jgi:hypothetical protein
MGVEKYVLKTEKLYPLYRIEVRDGIITVVNYSDMKGTSEYRIIDEDDGSFIYSKTNGHLGSETSLAEVVDTLEALTLDNGEDEALRLRRAGFIQIELNDIPYDVVRTAFESGMTIDCLCREYSLIEHTPDT